MPPVPQPTSRMFLPWAGGNWSSMAALAGSKAGVSGVAAIADSALGGIFQDWGNNPVSYEVGPRAELLSLVPQLFPEAATTGPELMYSIRPW